MSLETQISEVKISSLPARWRSRATRLPTRRCKRSNRPHPSLAQVRLVIGDPLVRDYRLETPNLMTRNPESMSQKSHVSSVQLLKTLLEEEQQLLVHGKEHCTRRVIDYNALPKTVSKYLQSAAEKLLVMPVHSGKHTAEYRKIGSLLKRHGFLHLFSAYLASALSVRLTVDVDSVYMTVCAKYLPEDYCPRNFPEGEVSIERIRVCLFQQMQFEKFNKDMER